MPDYGVIDQDGYYATVSVAKKPTGRWLSWVYFERGADFARLRVHASLPHPVPNDYPSEVKAVQAAYDYAHQVISERQLPDKSVLV